MSAGLLAVGKKPDLGQGSIGKLLLRLSLPAIVGQLINMLYNIVDRIYIGHMEEIGDLALTGVGLTFPLIMIVTAFSSLIGMGGAPLAAIKLGEGNQNEEDKILSSSFTALIGIGAILTGILLAFHEPLLFAFGAKETTIGYASDYIQIYACGSIFVMITLGMNAFVNAQGFAMVGMLTTAIGALINIILDPILIFGCNMGVKGAAIATVFSQAVSAVWVLCFTFGKKPVLRIRRAYLFAYDRTLLRVMALGLAPFIMQFTEGILQITFNSSLSFYGNDTYVGAMTIIASVMQAINLPIMGLAQGAQPIISYNYGANRISRVQKAARYMIGICIAFTVCMWILILAVPELFIRIFNDKPELVDVTVRSMRIYMLGLFTTGAQMSCQQSFVALGQAKTSIFLALLRKMILLIPLILILPLLVPAEIKPYAVFAAEPIADILAALTTTLLFMRTYRRLTHVQTSSLFKISSDFKGN